MLYNPPTGSVDPNAPYLGKNLQAGQQGSKVSPMAIEAPQREIVNALIAAGLVPTNSNLGQLAQAIPILARRELMISTALTKTIGAGGDFLTIPAAFNWLSKYRIDAGGEVVLQLLSGLHSITSPYTFYHPDGHRITLQGLLGSSISSADFTVTGSSSSARASDKTTNLAMARAKFATEIALSGSQTSLVSVGTFNLTLKNVLVSSDGMALLSPILAALHARWNLVNVVVAGGGETGLKSIDGGHFTLRNSFVFGCASENISIANGGTLSFEVNWGSFGSGGNGILVHPGGLAITHSPTPTYTSGLSKGNAGSGCYVFKGEANIQAGVFDGNAGSGVTVDGNGTGIFTNGSAPGACTASNNTLDAFNVINAGTARLAHTGGSGNGRFGYNAINQAYIERGSGTCTGASGSMSPALNTVGNGNALII